MDSEFKKPKSLSWTSKANHSQIINDDYIQDFLKGCRLPSKPKAGEVSNAVLKKNIEQIQLKEKHILTVDGSYTSVNVRKNFPSLSRLWRERESETTREQVYGTFVRGKVEARTVALAFGADHDEV